MLPLLVAFLPLLSAYVLIQSQSSSQCLSVPSSQNGSSSTAVAGATIVSADCSSSGASTWDISPGSGLVLYAQNSSLAMTITSGEAGGAVGLQDAVTWGESYAQW
jgi:hypothetical protein